MEINTVVFLISVFMAAESGRNMGVVKYFIVQSLASVVMVLNCAMVSIEANISVLVIQASIIVKLGAIPGHIWFISIIEDLSWLNILLVATVQKLLPLFVLISLRSILSLNFLIILSSLGGVLASLSLTLKRVFAYSRIVNLA